MKEEKQMSDWLTNDDDDYDGNPKVNKDVLSVEENINFLIQSITHNGNVHEQSEMTSFNNKQLREEVFKNNFIYRLMYCYNNSSNPYIYNRLKYINLVNEQNKVLLKTIPRVGKIWNPNGENAILLLYTKYAYEKLKEKPYPEDKLIFLMQLLNFWEDGSNLKKSLSLVKDETFKKWFLHEAKTFIPTINQKFITNSNKGALSDMIFEFCDRTFSMIRKCNTPEGL